MRPLSSSRLRPLTHRFLRRWEFFEIPSLTSHTSSYICKQKETGRSPQTSSNIHSRWMVYNGKCQSKMDDNWGYHGVPPWIGTICIRCQLQNQHVNIISSCSSKAARWFRPESKGKSSLSRSFLLVRKNCQFEVTCVLRGNLHPTSAPNKGKWEITVT